MEVWNFTIGGYQVIKKRLSYREEKLKGQPLDAGEVQYIQEIVRRIAAISFAEPIAGSITLDVKMDAFPWTD
jgi:hypothetical protein